MSGIPRLILTARCTDPPSGAAPTPFEMNGGTAVIGRSPTADWTLPDSNSLISSRHCDISFADGAYRLADHSTNGTFLNDATDRLPGPHVLSDGDRFHIGQYEIVARFENSPPPLAATTPGNAATTAAMFGAAAGPLPGPATPSWHPVPALVPVKETWPPTPMSALPEPAALARRGNDQPETDGWGKQSASYSVDWSRGGFGGTAAAAAPERCPSPPPQPVVPRRDGDDALAQFLTAAGLDPAIFAQEGPATLVAGGRLLRRLIGGLVVMLEARARAKSQMGAQTTIFTREGNNPLKFARTPDSALAQLLKPPIPGYMGADRAIEDSYRDLQLHQMATLKAMQGALRATLNRFSPDSIRQRAEKLGLLERIMPGAREAALWKAYEREFSGVAQGSDEAFMDVFAKEFRRAYDAEAAKMDAPPEA